jgi:hypothetical protein
MSPFCIGSLFISRDGLAGISMIYLGQLQQVSLCLTARIRFADIAAWTAAVPRFVGRCTSTNVNHGTGITESSDYLRGDARALSFSRF